MQNMRKVAHFSTALKAPWSTGVTLRASARKHDRQIIGMAEVNVQFGHGLARRGAGGRKSAIQMRCKLHQSISVRDVTLSRDKLH